MTNTSKDSEKQKNWDALRLYHYTNMHGLVGIVKSKSIWCTKIQYLNDASEYEHGFSFLKTAMLDNEQGLENAWKGLTVKEKDIDSSIQEYSMLDIFVSSFTELSDTLSQWRGYASDNGVYISFGRKKLKTQASAKNYSLLECVYEDDKKKNLAEKYIKRWIKILKDDGGRFGGSNETVKFIVKCFIKHSCRFKHESFKEEKEWRLISFPKDGVLNITPNTKVVKFRPSRTNLIPYTEFDLRTGEYPFRETQRTDRHNEECICIEYVHTAKSKNHKLMSTAIHELFKHENVYLCDALESNIPFRPE